MNKGRLEAFTDAVIAIILTILVLELQPPHSDHWLRYGNYVEFLPFI